MPTDQVDRTVVTTEPTPAGSEIVRTASRHSTTTGPGGSELARRIVVLLFGLIQLVIGAHIVILLLFAGEANDLMFVIVSISLLFVGPFEGILPTDSLKAAGSVFDITAPVVALVGWTVLELIVLWAVGIFRRDPA